MSAISPETQEGTFSSPQSDPFVERWGECKGGLGRKEDQPSTDLRMVTRMVKGSEAILGGLAMSHPVPPLSPNSWTLFGAKQKLLA